MHILHKCKTPNIILCQAKKDLMRLINDNAKLAPSSAGSEEGRIEEIETKIEEMEDALDEFAKQVISQSQ